MVHLSYISFVISCVRGMHDVSIASRCVLYGVVWCRSMWALAVMSPLDDTCMLMLLLLLPVVPLSSDFPVYPLTYRYDTYVRVQNLDQTWPSIRDDEIQRSTSARAHQEYNITMACACECACQMTSCRFLCPMQKVLWWHNGMSHTKCVQVNNMLLLQHQESYLYHIHIDHKHHTHQIVLCM